MVRLGYGMEIKSRECRFDGAYIYGDMQIDWCLFIQKYNYKCSKMEREIILIQMLGSKEHADLTARMI